jgi:hypothetical protein
MSNLEFVKLCIWPELKSDIDAQLELTIMSKRSCCRVCAQRRWPTTERSCCTLTCTCSWQMAEVIMGDSMTLMPAVSALLASPSDSAFAARWVVMSDEEQAVSIPMHGPAR